MDTLVVVAIVYLLAYVIWARVYFGRRHGVSLGWGWGALFSPGAIPSVLVGAAWPVTVFTHWSPEWCRHKSHVLARAEISGQFEAEEAQYQQRLRAEGRD